MTAGPLRRVGIATARSLGHTVRGGLGLVAGCNVLVAGYLALLTAAAARPPRQAPTGVGNRFVVLVPAHDEAEVISDTLRSLGELTYPSSLFSVHVVADNCSDETAEIVRTHGFAVHERHDVERRGKGPALNWLIDRVDPDDAAIVVVIDADTVVRSDFLSAMDAAFSNGAVIAQGFYSVRDPGGSAAAGIRYAALACRHHLRPLGRRRLGGSCGLFGNGMAFRRPVLRRHPWTGHLIEDAELQMRLLVADDQAVEYVPGAVVEAQMPGSLDDATAQNARWERGRLELAWKFLPILCSQLIHPRGRRRGARVDAIADLLLPPISVVIALQTVAISGEIIAAGVTRRLSFTRLLANICSVVILAAHIVAGLRSISAPASAFRSLLSAPRAMLWKVGLWARVLSPTSKVEWQRTTRTSTS